MNEIIRLRNLHKVYKQGESGVGALNGIDLDIETGKSVLMVGPSGAGKSTLLHIMGGLLSPTVGNVYFGDKDLYSLSDTALSRVRNEKIGFVFQSYHLLADFSALENVMLPAMFAGRKSKKKAEDLLEMVGLKNRMHHKPAELSGGEAQRVAIARALINEPDILLCDEPTGNLDSNAGSLIYGILWRINKEENKTLVVVTHNEALREDFNSVFYMRDGKMREGAQLWA